MLLTVALQFIIGHLQFTHLRISRSEKVFMGSATYKKGSNLHYVRQKLKFYNGLYQIKKFYLKVNPHNFSTECKCF